MEEITKGIANKIQNIRETVKSELDKLEKDLSTYSALLNVRGKKLLPYCEEGKSAYETFWYDDKVARIRPEYLNTVLHGTKEEMIAYVTEITAKVKKVHEDNLKIIKHNTEVIKTLSDFLVSLGLSAQRRVEQKLGRGRISSSYTDAYWLLEIKALFPISDPTFQSASTWSADALRTIDAYWAIQDKKAREEKEKTEQSRLFNAAVVFLTKRGKVMGTDYQANEATHFAKEVAEDELIETLTKEGGYLEFSGNDSCENCRGWKPGEHRCDCGNRRVYWARESASFEKPEVYPIAD